jgi:hypothetical protein
MIKHSHNSISPFLVNKQLVKLEGAEKALNIKSDCSFVVEVCNFFSPLVLRLQSLSKPFQKQNDANAN